MHGLDDLARVDACGIDRRHANVAVSQLALMTFRGTPSCASSSARLVGTNRRRRSARAADGGHARAQVRPLITQNNGRHRHGLSDLQPGLELFEAPLVHTHLAPVVALAAARENRSALRVETAFGEIERRMRKAARQSTTTSPRARAPCGRSARQRMTAMISSVRGGSPGYRRP